VFCRGRKILLSAFLAVIASRQIGPSPGISNSTESGPCQLLRFLLRLFCFACPEFLLRLDHHVTRPLPRYWVDASHNTLVTTGNGSLEPTTAEVTLFYNGGEGKYRLKKLLAPGEPFWLDIGQLIHDQIPDSYGHTIPPETMNGSYEFRDLDHPTVGQLYEGKLVIDKTYGHAAYGCGTCCGYSVPSLLPDPFVGPPDVNNTDVMQSIEQCGGLAVNLAGDGYDWGSSDTAVATLPTEVLHTVAIGAATGSGTVDVQGTHPAPQCPLVSYTPQQAVSVGQSMALIGDTCQANKSGYNYSGLYFNTATSCSLASPMVPVPSGGTCVACGTLSNGTEKTCYQTTVNGCTIQWGNNSTRVANKACSELIDPVGYTEITIPLGCTQ
jgi:hypothetical protein